MNELAATIREALATLAASDPQLHRFGATHHRYVLSPPLAASDSPVLEALDDDLRGFATAVGAGGAGPYYGWIPLERAARYPIAAPAGVTAWTRALPLAHLGCGYAAVLPLDGIARGEVWIDARAIDLVRPIHASFTAFYLDWIDRLLRAAWPDAFVPADACALPAALSSYFAAYEHDHAVAAGTLAGAGLRDALAALGTGAIVIGAEGPLFERGDRADPCVACARLLETLGVTLSVVAAGHTPIPLR